MPRSRRSPIDVAWRFHGRCGCPAGVALAAAAAALVQVGLLEPADVPVTGAEQARKLLDQKLPSDTLISR